MTAYSVSTQPVAIFPDGVQDAFAITNNGPWTVLIDTQSSIGPGSYELPPLSTITWDPFQPLWVMAKPPPDIALSASTIGYVNASVLITGNTDAVMANRTQASVKLSDVNQNLFAGLPSVGFPIETQAFESITIDYTTLAQDNYTSTEPPTSDFMQTYIYWYSADGVVSIIERFTHPVQNDGGGHAQRLVTSVKDAYAIIVITDTAGGAAYTVAYRTYGQLRELPEAFHYWVPITPGISGSPPLNVWDTGLAAQRADTCEIPEWWNAATPLTPLGLWLSPIKAKLWVNLRVLNTTAAGSLILENPETSLILNSVAIPISAAANVQLSTEYIPVGIPLRLRSTATTGIGKLTMVWQD